MAGVDNSKQDGGAECGVRVWCDWGCKEGGGGIARHLVWRKDAMMM